MTKSISNCVTVGFLCCVTMVGIASADQPLAPLQVADEVTLAEFGLHDVQFLTEPLAATVRGEGGMAKTSGMSFVSGFLVDSNSTSSLFGLDANSAGSTVAVQSAPIRRVQQVHQHQSQLNLSLTVNEYLGIILGGSGGAASALFR